MAKIYTYSSKDWNLKDVERLAKRNREKSLKEFGDVSKAERENRRLDQHKRTETQADIEDSRAHKLFKEMKERDF